MRLAAPARASRPTTDRVRESLFGLLESRGYLEDARVLDLFAGTGALAIECVSRGAATATLVEKDQAALRVIQENVLKAKKSLAAAEVAGEFQILPGAVKPKLQQLRAKSAVFDLVLVDPPYEFSDGQLVAELDGLQELLAPGALVLLERDRAGFNGTIPGLRQCWEKSYGDTRVIALEAAPTGDLD